MSDFISKIVRESQERYGDAWTAMAEAGPKPVTKTADGLRFAIAGLPIALFNAAFAVEPVRSLPELRQLAARAVEEFRRAGVPGTFTLPSSWMPRGAQADIEEQGLPVSSRFLGMRTARLTDPQYAVGARDVRPVEGAEAAEILARLNGEAYGMPESAWGHLRLPRFWRLPARAYASFESGSPAAAGAAIVCGDCCYVMWMATRPESRARGHAEAIIRQAWRDARELAGAKVTVLHATDLGKPVYLRLGYVAVAEFPGFTWDPAP